MTANSSIPEIRQLFAKRLKALRIPRGYTTARSFAQALEIDENRYTRYERAEVEPDLSLLVKICALLGISPNELLSDRHAHPSPAVGFAETPPEPQARGAGDQQSGNPSPLNVLMWRLAEEVATLDATGTSTTLDNVARTSTVYCEISAEPFAYAARLLSGPLVAGHSAEKIARLGGLMEQVIAAAKGDVSWPAGGT
jgi:transcriptional regulator with XRE-family HTH domain